MSDLIERWAVIELLSDRRCNTNCFDEPGQKIYEELSKAIENVKDLPSAQSTLYGYKIEHLAYIARVMEKEGVTADYAVRTFDDISRALRMIIEEAQERVWETLNERYDLQTGGDRCNR